VSFAAITLCVASQRAVPKVGVYFVIDSVLKLLDTPSYITWSHLLQMFPCFSYFIFFVISYIIQFLMFLFIPLSCQMLGTYEILRLQGGEDSNKTLLGCDTV
jgi:hypothetical protein